MNRIVGLIFSTDGVVLVFLVAAVWVFVRCSTAARRFALSAAIVYSLASTYAVSSAVSLLLTHRYHRFTTTDLPEDPRETTAVVVLGAGDQTVLGPDGDSLSLMNDIGATRVLEASRVFRLVNPAYVISSGGMGRAGRMSVTDAELMRDALIRTAVPASKIRLDSESHDTHDEAVLASRILRSLNVQRLVIVTSDIHMARALGAFRASGWSPIPAVALDPRRGLSSLDRWLPSALGLSFSAAVVHELIGIPYYWVMGWWK